MEESFSLFIIIIILLIFSAFFSGSETAFFSLSKIQLKKLKKSDTKSSKRIFRLLRNPKELLIIILLGNTLVNVIASSIAALIAINLFPDSAGIPIFVEIVIMTLLLLVFGEITPKLIAFSSPERFSGFSGLLLETIKYIFYPIIKLLELISSVFTIKNPELSNGNLTTEEFKNLINSNATNASLEENEKQIIASIFRFSSTTAREIMIPRVDIVASESSDNMSQLKENIYQSGHSRIPIYKKNIDNIIGVIYAKDLILNPTQKGILSQMRPAFFITENIKIHNLLNQMKNKKLSIAIVVDEYGGTSGLLTLEDILEELVGEIQDEYDKEKPMFSEISEKEFLINGMFSLSELNEKFMLDIDEEKYDNLAEFLYDNFNKVPHKNDSFIYKNNYKFTITNLKAQRINYARMIILDNVES